MVAVKAFRLDLLPEDVARLADGLRRLVGTAGHLAAGLEGTTAYLAMDYHAAETLDVALRHLAPAPLETALPILRGIAEWIDRAWANGPSFGHGALHPRDVFITPGTGDVNITGFGVGPALEATGARSPIRRPYSAPERAAGEAWDQRADVYSLGAIAHELLTGRRPAGPGEQDGTLPTSMAPEMRVQIRRVLSKALAESPAQRFATAQELIEALMDPTLVAESDPAPTPDEIASAALANAPLTPPVSEDVATSHVPADAVPLAPPPVPPAPPVSVAPPPVRRQRMKTPVPAPRPPVRVAARDASDAPLSPAAPVLSIADAPLRHDDGASRVTPPLALPPPFPWVAMAAVLGAGLVLGAVGGYQFAMERRAPSTPTVVAPAVTAPLTPQPPAPSPTTPAPGDTEVAVADTPAATRRDEAAPKSPAAPARPAAAPGRVLVRSTPSGAQVAIDGKPAGRTPLTARDLALGTHAVVVSRPGFATETRKVTLTARASSATLTVALEPEKPARTAVAKGATTGSVTVDSRPKGAQVTIDGRAIGVTPLSAPGLSPGTHSVRVELAGHKPVTTTVVVKAGETTKLAVTLEQR